MLDETDKTVLLKLARTTLEAYFSGNSAPDYHTVREGLLDACCYSPDRPPRMRPLGSQSTMRFGYQNQEDVCRERSPSSPVSGRTSSSRT